MNNEIIIIQKAEFKKILLQCLQELQKSTEDQKSQSIEWINSTDVPSYLGISRRSWQNYRDKKLIPFSQIGRKIWVKRSDLDQFLTSCQIESHGQTFKF